MREYTQNEKCLVWLQSADALTYRAGRALLAQYGSAENAFACFDASAEQAVGARAWAQLSALREKGLDALLDAVRACGAQAVFEGGEGYPSLLRHISDPPRALFLRGAGALDERSVAIVGSRQDTRYGRAQAFSIARDLAKAGVTVVSGLARGIDTAAHEGALAGGGRTVAVLGSGLANVYPEENKKLAQAIALSGGAVVSEFPLNAEPLARHFPIRNRIISGISAALLLIEGGARSGTMITAGCAAQQGREVFALPGMVDAPGSVAPLRLLREGASLCTGAKDILEDMRWIPLLPESAPPAPPPPEADSALSAPRRAILRALAPEQKRFEELLAQTGLDPGLLTGELTLMEMDGVIEPRAGRAYALKR